MIKVRKFLGKRPKEQSVIALFVVLYLTLRTRLTLPKKKAGEVKQLLENEYGIETIILNRT